MLTWVRRHSAWEVVRLRSQQHVPVARLRRQCRGRAAVQGQHRVHCCPPASTRYASAPLKAQRQDCGSQAGQKDNGPTAAEIGWT